MINIIKVKKHSKREENLGGGYWLQITYKQGRKGRNIHQSLIHDSNIDENWSLSGLAERVFGENINCKV